MNYAYMLLGVQLICSVWCLAAGVAIASRRKEQDRKW